MTNFLILCWSSLGLKTVVTQWSYLLLPSVALMLWPFGLTVLITSGYSTVRVYLNTYKHTVDHFAARGDDSMFLHVNGVDESKNVLRSACWKQTVI